MSEHVVPRKASPAGRETLSFPLAAWVRANALGIGIAFALFALVGGVIEAMGADHDSVARNVPALIAMITGGTVFALLRRRVLDDHPGSRWQALVIGGGLTAGFAVGSVAVPLDFVVAILVAGVLGGALQLRTLRRRLVDSRRLVIVGVGAWLAAAVAAVASAVLVADVVINSVLGLGDVLDGVAGFVAILALLGLVGGAAGGAIEGAALRRRIAHAS